MVSRGEERSAQGLLRAKEAETEGGRGGGGFEATSKVEVVLAAVEGVEIDAFFSAKKTLAEASEIDESAIMVE